MPLKWNKLSENSSRIRTLTTREITVFAMLGAVMYASKLIMEVLPNVHLLGTFIVAFTCGIQEKGSCIRSIPILY